ncbi:MAG: hypothetical protein ACR2KW_10830 [Rubrobacter sp.]
MENAVRRFDGIFSYWGIELPEDVVARRERGRVLKSGWSICYLFGSDEKGEFLDFYASHRMTDDWHTRTYESGEEQNLEAIQSMRVVSPNPKEDARLEAEYFARNRRVEEMLREKGFEMYGDEPPLTQVNRLLRLEGKNRK